MFLKNPFLILNYKWAFIVYCLLFFVLTLPLFLRGEVIAPHRQYIEIRAIDTNVKSGRIETRTFSDFSNSYIPEFFQNLKNARSGWLTLWTDQNELGRPTYQISGLSPANLPLWVVALGLCLLAFDHPLYVLAVKYFGFNLSCSTPLGSI